MEYIQELQSLTADVELNKEELSALNEFTDEKVRFQGGQKEDSVKASALLSAFRKLENSKKFTKYLDLISLHCNDNMDDFYKGMDKSC